MHHFHEVAKTERRAESAEHLLREAKVIPEMAKKDHIKDRSSEIGVRSVESAEVESEVRRAESVVPIAIGIHVTTKLVPIKSVIKAVHQAEKIVTLVLKRNHLTEIVHLTEKVVAAVAHRVNVVPVPVLI
ncbi:MAG: hypothetical protein IPJ26_03605 [Bacteroidetes bacterium]|nr:hypothetical protein [Bacteroidota bacterium]